MCKNTRYVQREERTCVQNSMYSWVYASLLFARNYHFVWNSIDFQEPREPFTLHLSPRSLLIEGFFWQLRLGLLSRTAFHMGGEGEKTKKASNHLSKFYGGRGRQTAKKFNHPKNGERHISEFRL